MNTTQTNVTIRKRLAMGVVVGGVVLASFVTTGCDGLTAERVTGLTSGNVEEAAYQFDALRKSELGSKITFNHNETSLASAAA